MHGATRRRADALFELYDAALTKGAAERRGGEPGTGIPLPSVSAPRRAQPIPGPGRPTN